MLECHGQSYHHSYVTVQLRISQGLRSDSYSFETTTGVLQSDRHSGGGEPTSSGLDIALALVLECGLLLSGCASLRTDRVSDDAARIDLRGVWNGMSVNDCSPIQAEPSRCRAVERISFTVLRHDKSSWGFYRCAPGTTPCYNMVDRGEIKYMKLTGRMLWFRVMRDDHSSCLFDTVPTLDRMRGQFWCFQGDELIERGSWQAERAY